MCDNECILPRYKDRKDTQTGTWDEFQKISIRNVISVYLKGTCESYENLVVYRIKTDTLLLLTGRLETKLFSKVTKEWGTKGFDIKIIRGEVRFRD